MNVTEYMSQLKVITKCHKIFFTNSYLKFFFPAYAIKKKEITRTLTKCTCSSIKAETRWLYSQKSPSSQGLAAPSRTETSLSFIHWFCN